MASRKDKEMLRALAAEQAEIAALPAQEEMRRLWRKLNAKRPERPMVMIDQVCWNEMNVDDELTLRCEDAECRKYEEKLRRTIYQWRHFPVDMVVEPNIYVERAVEGFTLGLSAMDEKAVGDPTNSVVGHRFINQLENDSDLDKIKTPHLVEDKAESMRRLELAHEIFDGRLEVVACHDRSYLSVWDPISSWMGVENALYAIIDRPEFIAELVRRMVQGYMAMFDQMEELGLLHLPQPLIHCTGAWTEELPSAGFDPAKPRTQDIWGFGLAQMLATVSPEMFDELEVQPLQPLFERFGLIYYGCCDPLDKKMEQVRKIPNLRKVSMSPWVDEERGAAEIKGDFVYSRKPNPALLAWDSFKEEDIRSHLQKSIDACRRHGCPLEIILKDISTVRYQPQRLWRWAEIAMELVNG